MPLTKVRRPKYERHDIKQQLFSSFLSCQRLHKIQRLINSKNIDGLLIIIGIDGRFNAGSLELFNYLFFDIFSTRTDDIKRSKLDDDLFDDVMVCITCDEVHVYCNGANYWLLLPYVACWPGLRLHCLSEIEMEDSEILEQFKIEAFAEMTRFCDKLAVVTKSSIEDENEPFDPMVVEGWPIVQSYAYDDFGKYSPNYSKKGFFTLVHKVIDISKEVHTICKEIDPVHLENFYQKILPQMEGLMENIFQLLDSKSLSDNFEIEEDIFEEPVKSYFNHLKNNKTLISKCIQMNPLALSGTNTRKSVLMKRLWESAESEGDIRDKLVTNPKHMIIQCVSLHTGIVMARTIFLQGCSNVVKPSKEMDETYADVMKLSTAYNAIISTSDFVISKLKSSKNIVLDETEAKNHLKYSLNKMRYSDCSFRIITIGDTNNPQGFLIIIQGVVFDIINEDRGENIGSVIFADTFVVTSTPVNKEDNLTSVLRLGKKVPLFSYWTNSNLSKLHQTINEIYEIEPLATEMTDIILTNRHFQETTVQQLCCTFFPDRLLLFNKKVGATFLYPDSVEVVEGESYCDWTIFSITCQVSKSKNTNWIWNKNNEKDVLHLIFSNSSKLRKSITSIVIPKWKETMKITSSTKIRCPDLDINWKFIQNWMINNQLSVSETSSQSIIDGISEDVHQSQLVKVHNSMNYSLIHRKSCIRVFAQLMVMNYSLRYYDNINYLETIFESHKEIFESCQQKWQCHSFMDYKKLMNVKKPLPNINDQSSIVVTVICGLPGSGQEFLTRKIMKIIHDDFDWLLVNPILIKDVTSATENIIKDFENIDDNHNNNLRILLIAPPLSFPSEIVRRLKAVVSRIPIVIGNITVCINPETAYLDNREYTLPGLLDMCNEGWVNTIILTGPDCNSIKTTTLHRMLRARNELCTIYLTPKADVTKELDTILSKVAFQQERFDFARVLYNLTQHQTHFGCENIKKISKRFYEIFYPIYGPLLKENIIRASREIFKNLTCAPFNGNIYFIEGIINIEEDPKRFYSLTSVSLTKQLIIFALPNKENRGDYSRTSYTQLTYIRIYVTSEETVNSNDMEKISNLKENFLLVLRNFQRQIPLKKKLITTSDMTLQQIDEIHSERHLEALPEGWFYNGITYVHMDGSRSDKHPLLPAFIADFISAKNAEIVKNNGLLDLMTVTDAFAKF